MTKTLSTMQPLGTHAADFQLNDVSNGKVVKLIDGQSYPATVIMFICNHCPFVKHINQGIAQVSKDYMKRGIRFIAINSNDISSYPDDSPENMKLVAKANHFDFPYLFDETQEVAKSFQAACTPDFFILNSDYDLVYRGQFDDSRPNNVVPVTGRSIRDALDCMLEGKDVSSEQKPSIGCNIKWKAD